MRGERRPETQDLRLTGVCAWLLRDPFHHPHPGCRRGRRDGAPRPVAESCQSPAGTRNSPSLPPINTPTKPEWGECSSQQQRRSSPLPLTAPVVRCPAPTTPRTRPPCTSPPSAPMGR